MGGGVLETKRRADRHYPLTHFETIGVAQSYGRQIFGINLDQRHVGIEGMTDDARLELGFVVEDHGDALGRGPTGGVDHVAVVVGMALAVWLIGDEEVANKTVAIRDRRAKEQYNLTQEEFMVKLTQQLQEGKI